MKKTSISGSVAAFIEAAAYVHGIIIFVIVLNFNKADSVSQKLSLLMNNQGVFLSAYFIIYILFGISLVFLTISLYKVFKESGSVITSYIFSFGIIWAVLVTATGMIHNISIGYLSEIYSNDPSQAEITYSVLHIITEGIGGGNELSQ